MATSRCRPISSHSIRKKTEITMAAISYLEMIIVQPILCVTYYLHLQMWLSCN